MARAVPFHGVNMVLGAPPGRDDVEAMHTFSNGTCSVSCWQLEPEELAEIVRTGCVFISVLSGRTQPPVFVSSESVMHGFAHDYGGTWKVAR